MAGKPSATELGLALQITAGVVPIVAQVDEGSGAALLAAPTVDGLALVIGMVDADGSHVALTFTPEDVTQLRDGLSHWLEGRG